MRTTKKTAVVGGTVVALMGAGVAFAAWTTTGTGSGAATAGSAGNVLVAQTGTATGLFPTGSKNVTITVTNNAPYKVAMDSVTPGTTTVDSGHSGCTASVVSTVAKTGLSDVLDVSGAGATASYVFSFTMDNAAENACQGATFTIPFTASGHSSN